jgi:hypothetical protein
MQSQKLAQRPTKLAQSNMSGVKNMGLSSQRFWTGASNPFAVCGKAPGVDFMTIAAWVGHRDGGVLIGKVYGHLANEHRKAMAQRVNMGPAAVATTA